jgi:hypothetical protein
MRCHVQCTLPTVHLCSDFRTVSTSITLETWSNGSASRTIRQARQHCTLPVWLCIFFMYLFMVCSTTLASDILIRKWNETVVVWVKVLPRHLPGVTDETHEKPFRIADLTRKSPWYEAAALTRLPPLRRGDPSFKVPINYLPTRIINSIRQALGRTDLQRHANRWEIRPVLTTQFQASTKVTR